MGYLMNNGCVVESSKEADIVERMQALMKNLEQWD
jgi:hypothetical protein